MKIWIENKIGYLEGYSTMEQPNTVELDVDQEPLDFSNWRFDGHKLIRDSENVPEPEPTPPTEFELLKAENDALKEKVNQQAQELTDTQLAVADIYELMAGGTTE